MGVVWAAEDTTLDRRVAIKILPEQVANDGDRLARFDREAKVLASLSHPNIASIYGFHQTDGLHYLAMELVERMIKAGIKVICFDLTNQYAEELEVLY